MEKKRATEILFELAHDSPNTLIEPVLDAGPEAFKTLFPHIEAARDQAIPLLRAEFDPEFGFPRGFQRVVLGGGPEVSWRVTRFEAK